MRKFSSKDAEHLISTLEREDVTLFRHYLTINVLNTALAQHRPSSPIIGPDAIGQDLLDFIRRARPDINAFDRMDLKHAIDDYLRGSKRALEFWEIDPTVMGR